MAFLEQKAHGKAISSTINTINPFYPAFPLADLVLRVFKSNTGCGVIEYLNDLKVERAKTMIREERYNYTEIAGAINPSHPPLRLADPPAAPRGAIDGYSRSAPQHLHGSYFQAGRLKKQQLQTHLLRKRELPLAHYIE
ncbi:MAG: hypothetical protein K0Q81_312 [Paenibacillus sp.]|nr:hypothetical protein [Paenibacillus sp.]